MGVDAVNARVTEAMQVRSATETLSSVSSPNCTSSLGRYADSLCCQFVQDAHAKSTEAMKSRMQGLASSLGLPPQ